MTSALLAPQSANQANGPNRNEAPYISTLLSCCTQRSISTATKQQQQHDSPLTFSCILLGVVQKQTCSMEKTKEGEAGQTVPRPPDRRKYLTSRMLCQRGREALDFGDCGGGTIAEEWLLQR